MSTPLPMMMTTEFDPAQVAAFRREAARGGFSIVEREPLARHTTFRIGGPADLYASATSPDDLSALARLARVYGLPALILGGGSNMLVSDAGVRGLVIANQSRAVVQGERQSLAPGEPAQQIIADSGAALAGLARWAMREGWSGLEWAVSVPGTVGGAIIGNAGAHARAISDNLAWAELALPEGQQVIVTADELALTYRSSLLKQKLAQNLPAPVVLRAGFTMAPGDITEMAGRAEQFLARRRETQPVEPSAGSIFRNPAGDHAGRLIETAGLKGYRQGGACISARHANFIVNDSGRARAADVLALIELIRQRVLESSGIELVPEILFVGDWSSHPPYAPARTGTA